MAVEGFLDMRPYDMRPYDMHVEGRPEGRATGSARRCKGVTARLVVQVLSPFGSGVGANANWVGHLETWMSDQTDGQSCSDYLACDAHTTYAG